MFNRILKVLMLSIAVTSVNASADLVIKNARLIDGTGAEPIDGETIVVANGRIVSFDGSTARPGSKQIDAKGKTVMPGMADTHLHTSMEYSKNKDGVYGMPVRFTWSDGEEFLTEFLDNRYAPRMKSILEAGVTTVVDTGAVTSHIVAMKNKLNSGEIVGPRMYVSGAIISAPGGHPSGIVCYGNEWCIQNLACATQSEKVARQCVRDMAESGVDGIKIVFDDAKGFFEGIPKLDPEVMKAAIDEAHKLGLGAITHTLTVDDSVTTVLAGTDGLAHSVDARNVNEDGMLVTSDGQSLSEVLNRYNVPMTTSGQFPENQNPGQALRSMTDGGVNLMFGTDWPTPWEEPLYTRHMKRELQLLLSGGFSEMEIIQMLTGNSRLHPFTAEDHGTIEIGQRADIIVLSGDPLKELMTVTRPVLVIKDGEVLVDKR